jgi:hypothetical protein
LAYLLVFFYEKGYADYFNIPSRFITVELTNVLLLAATGILLTVWLSSVLNLTTLYLFKNVHPKDYRFRVGYLFLFLLFFIEFYAIGFVDSWHVVYWITPLAILVIVASIRFFSSRLSKRQRKKAMTKSEEKHTDNNIVGIDQVLETELGAGYRPFYYLTFVAVAALVVGSMGTGQALRQNEFLVTNTSPEMVVLQTYGDTFICAPFDRNTGEVQTSFVFIKMADDPNIVFRREYTGRLHPIPIKPTATPIPSPLAIGTPAPLPTNLAPSAAP